MRRSPLEELHHINAPSPAPLLASNARLPVGIFPLCRSGGTATVDPVALASSSLDEPEASKATAGGQDERITITDLPGTSGEKQSSVSAMHIPASSGHCLCAVIRLTLTTPKHQPPSLETARHCLTRAHPHRMHASPAGRSLLDIRGLTLRVPSSGVTLVDSLTLSVTPGQSLLIMGPSGAGKTSILRQGQRQGRAHPACALGPGDPALHASCAGPWQHLILSQHSPSSRAC